MSGRGFIYIDRQIDDWRWRNNAVVLGLWTHILLSANWKDGWFLGYHIPRGSYATSIRRMAEDTGVSEKTIRKWLKRFEEDGQIEIRGTNRFTVIKVINYDKYQNYEYQAGEQRSEQRSEQGSDQSTEQRSEQGLDNRKNNKEVKKEKKEKNIFVPPSREEVRDYCEERHNFVDPDRFVDYYTANGWMVGRNKMKDWKATVRTWEKNSEPKNQKRKELAF